MQQEVRNNNKNNGGGGSHSRSDSSRCNEIGDGTDRVQHALKTRARTACCGFKPQTRFVRNEHMMNTGKAERQLNRMWHPTDFTRLNQEREGKSTMYTPAVLRIHSSHCMLPCCIPFDAHCIYTRKHTVNRNW